MGYPAIFTHHDKSVLLQVVSHYRDCMRKHGRRVTVWPMIEKPAGHYKIVVDVCGQYDKALDEKCAAFPGTSHQHVDLRKYSPGTGTKLKVKK